MAGILGSWTLTFRAGVGGIAVGGGIRLDTDSDTDWGEPQLHAPAAPDFTTIHTTGPADLSMVIRGGFLKQLLEVTVRGRPLREGDEIQIHIGDRSRGGPGSRAQTFAETRRVFRLQVDSTGEGLFREISTQPFLEIIGADAVRLSPIAPSQVVVDEPFSLKIRALDRFGNPDQRYCGALHLSAVPDRLQLPETVEVAAHHRGVVTVPGVLARHPGRFRIAVHDGAERTGVSNPIAALETEPARSTLWGDLHGQVRDADKLHDYFRFAREVSALDFASHQRNDHEIDRAHWETTQRVLREVNAPGQFVALLGYEWSGAHERGGDHNVYFLDDDRPIRRSGHDRVEDRSDLDTDLPHVSDLHRAFRDQPVLIVPHVGGRPANLEFHEPALEPVIEVHSTHGTFEWFLEEALERGYRVGFVAGSDDYKGRLGGATPGLNDRRFARGGLTAILAEELTREGIFEALRARRCYATTGERILLEVSADGHPMGAAYETTRPPRIRVDLSGTAGIERVDLFRGRDQIHTYPATVTTPLSNRVKLIWEGSSRRKPYSGVLWEGALQATGGELLELKPMLVDRPDEYVRAVGRDRVEWNTFTAGGLRGLEVDVAPGTLLHISCTSTPTECCLGRVSAPMSQIDRAAIDLRIDDLGADPMIVEFGSVGRRLSVRRLPVGVPPLETSFNFLDREVSAGTHAYWIRVLQVDGAMAWSSPIFASVATDRTPP